MKSADPKETLDKLPRWLKVLLFAMLADFLLGLALLVWLKGLLSP